MADINRDLRVLLKERKEIAGTELREMYMKRFGKEFPPGKLKNTLVPLAALGVCVIESRPTLGLGAPNMFVLEAPKVSAVHKLKAAEQGTNRQEEIVNYCSKGLACELSREACKWFHSTVDNRDVLRSDPETLLQQLPVEASRDGAGGGGGGVRYNDSGSNSDGPFRKSSKLCIFGVKCLKYINGTCSFLHTEAELATSAAAQTNKIPGGFQLGDTVYLKKGLFLASSISLPTTSQGVVTGPSCPFAGDAVKVSFQLNGQLVECEYVDVDLLTSIKMPIGFALNETVYFKSKRSKLGIHYGNKGTVDGPSSPYDENSVKVIFEGIEYRCFTIKTVELSRQPIILQGGFYAGDVVFTFGYFGFVRGSPSDETISVVNGTQVEVYSAKLLFKEPPVASGYKIGDVVYTCNDIFENGSALSRGSRGIIEGPSPRKDALDVKLDSGVRAILLCQHVNKDFIPGDFVIGERLYVSRPVPKDNLEVGVLVTVTGQSMPYDCRYLRICLHDGRALNILVACLMSEMSIMAAEDTREAALNAFMVRQEVEYIGGNSELPKNIGFIEGFNLDGSVHIRQKSGKIFNVDCKDLRAVVYITQPISCTSGATVEPLSRGRISYTSDGTNGIPLGLHLVLFKNGTSVWLDPAILSRDPGSHESLADEKNPDRWPKYRRQKLAEHVLDLKIPVDIVRELAKRAAGAAMFDAVPTKICERFAIRVGGSRPGWEAKHVSGGAQAASSGVTKDAVQASPASDASWFRVGVSVEVLGLTAQTQYNGQIGTVVRFDKKQGRYEVRLLKTGPGLELAKVIVVRPDNLRSVPEPSIQPEILRSVPEPSIQPGKLRSVPEPSIQPGKPGSHPKPSIQLGNLTSLAEPEKCSSLSEPSIQPGNLLRLFPVPSAAPTGESQVSLPPEFPQGFSLGDFVEVTHSTSKRSRASHHGVTKGSLGCVVGLSEPFHAGEIQVRFNKGVTINFGVKFLQTIMVATSEAVQESALLKVEPMRPPPATTVPFRMTHGSAVVPCLTPDGSTTDNDQHHEMELSAKAPLASTVATLEAVDFEKELERALRCFLELPQRCVNIQGVMEKRAKVDYPDLDGLDDDDGESDDDNDDEKCPQGASVPSGESTASFTNVHTDNSPITDVNSAVKPRPLESDISETDFIEFVASTGKFFEEGLWEIELTDGVVRWFKKNKTKNRLLCKLVITRLRTLSLGYWNERNRKILVGTKNCTLYEANINDGQRIIWEKAVNLSERLSSFSKERAEEIEVAAVHVEMIRVWAIVENHDNISKEMASTMQKIDLAHSRGQNSRIKSTLVPLPKSESLSTRDIDGTEIQLPITFTASAALVGVALKQGEGKRQSYPLGSQNASDYCLQKFYSFNSHILGCLFNSKSKVEASLPFKMASKEYEVARLRPEKSCGILLMGRSGTGKTSVQCYRLSFDWVNYWRIASVDGEPRLRTKLPKLGLDDDNGGDEGDGGDRKRVTQAESFDSQPLVHLRQLFVTKSMCLRTEVQRVSRDLIRGSGVVGAEVEPDGADSVEFLGTEGLETLGNVPEGRFPLFSTLAEFLGLLDRTLPGGPFLNNAEGSMQGTELSGLDAYFDNDDNNDDNIVDDIAPRAEEAVGGRFSTLSMAKVVDEDGRLDFSEVQHDRAPQQEMTWLVFITKVFRRLPKKLADEVEPTLLWTEINSYLKGSVDALEVLSTYYEPKDVVLRNQKLKMKYFNLGKKRSAIMKHKREIIWELFEEYEKLRKQKHFFDQNDFVADLYRRLQHHGNCGVYFHKLYCDEVQDFTMAELFLLFRFTDPNESFLAGDTAQTIARGVGFQFTDLKSLYKRMDDGNRGQWTINIPSPYSLVTSYRSHVGVLQLASSVVKVLYKYFPRAIDKLGLDQGLFDGPKPKILDVDDIAELTVMLLGHQRVASGRIDFGSEQVILVRNDEARRNLPPSLAESAIVLTVFEAKGLEFNDVLLWDFFKDSPAEKEWRVLYDYWDKYKEENTEAEEDPAESCGDVRAESFDKMEFGVRTKRPLEFEEGKYALLEEELKFLYCAITRARINVWIIDFDKTKRDPAFRWFSEAKLVDVVSKHCRIELSPVGSKSSPREFQKRGLYFQEMAWQHQKPDGLLDAAVKCFRQAGARDLMNICEAQLCAVQALDLARSAPGGKLSPATKQVLIAAATRCLSTDGTIQMIQLAANLLVHARKYEASGRILLAVGGIKPCRAAAVAFHKAGLHRDQATALVAAGEFTRGIEVYRKYRYYKDAIAVFDASTKPPPVDLLKMHVRQLMREGRSDQAALQTALARLPTLDDRVELLESEDGHLSEIVKLLILNGERSRAAELCLKHHAFLEAADVYSAEEPVRSAECTLLHVRSKIRGITSFPAEVPGEDRSTLEALALGAIDILDKNRNDGLHAARGVLARLTGDNELALTALAATRELGPLFAFAFDDWLVLNSPLEVFGEPSVLQLLHKDVPALIVRATKLMRSKGIRLDEDLASHLEVDIKETGDPAVVGICKSSPLMQLAEELELSLRPSSSRAGYLLLSHDETKMISCVYLLRSAAKFCLKISLHNGDMPLSPINAAALSAGLLLQCIRNDAEQCRIGHLLKITYLNDEATAKFQQNIESIATVLFSLESDPEEIRTFTEILGTLPKNAAQSISSHVEREWKRLLSLNPVRLLQSVTWVLKMWQSSLLMDNQQSGSSHFETTVLRSIHKKHTIYHEFKDIFDVLYGSYSYKCEHVPACLGKFTTWIRGQAFRSDEPSALLVLLEFSGTLSLTVSGVLGRNRSSRGVLVPTNLVFRFLRDPLVQPRGDTAANRRSKYAFLRQLGAMKGSDVDFTRYQTSAVGSLLSLVETIAKESPIITKELGEPSKIRLSILLLLIMVNIPNIPATQKHRMLLITSLISSLNVLDVCTQGWTRTGAAGVCLRRLLLDTKMTSFSSVGGKLLAKELDFSELRSGRDPHSGKQLDISAPRLNVSKEQAARQAEDAFEALETQDPDEGSDEVDIAAVIEVENKSLEDATDARTAEQERTERDKEKAGGLVGRVVSKWWTRFRQQRNAPKSNKEQDVGDDSSASIFKDIVAVLEPLWLFDNFDCKVCRLKFAGRTPEEHAHIVSTANPNCLQYLGLKAAGHIIVADERSLQRRVQFEGTSEDGKCFVQYLETGQRQAFNPEQLSVPLVCTNADYWHSTFIQKVRELDSLGPSAEDDDVTRQRTRSSAKSSRDSSHHCSRVLRHLEHSTDPAHVERILACDSYMKTVETTALTAIVAAIVTQRHVRACLDDPRTDLAAREELEVCLAPLSKQVDEQRARLARTRKSNSHLVTNTIKSLLNDAEALRCSTEKAQQLLAIRTPQTTAAWATAPTSSENVPGETSEAFHDDEDGIDVESSETNFPLLDAAELYETTVVDPAPAAIKNGDAVVKGRNNKRYGKKNGGKSRGGGGGPSKVEAGNLVRAQAGSGGGAGGSGGGGGGGGGNPKGGGKGKSNRGRGGLATRPERGGQAEAGQD